MPACEQADSTLVPRPRTQAVRNRSSRISGSSTTSSPRHGVMPRQAGLVAGLTRNGAAREEQVGDRVRLSTGGDPTAGGFDRFEGGFGPEHREDTKGREDA